jgi:membrane protein implicated in regulation of membrane protease activity
LRRVEIATLSFLLFGIFLFTLGAVLYMRKIMVQNLIDWEIQLALFGLIFIMIALVISKILSRVDIDG